MVRHAVAYAGAQVRGLDIFQNRSLLSRTRAKLARVFKDVPNLLTQHRPLVAQRMHAPPRSAYGDMIFLSSFAYLLSLLGKGWYKRNQNKNHVPICHVRAACTRLVDVLVRRAGVRVEDRRDA